MTRIQYPCVLSWGRQNSPALFFVALCTVTAFLMSSAGCSLPGVNNQKHLPVAQADTRGAQPQQYLNSGLEAFKRGHFEQAAEDWQEAARLYEAQHEPGAQCEALIRLARAHQSLGQHQKAREYLEFALKLAEKTGDRKTIGSIFGSIGNTYIATGPKDQALRYLTEALKSAKENNDHELSATVLNNLGNFYTSQQQFPRAVASYSEARTLSLQAGNNLLAAVALANTAQALLRAEKYNEVNAVLDECLHATQALEASHDKAYALITIGLGYQELTQYNADAHDVLQSLASDAFHQAVTVAETIQDPRATSYAWGYLGKIEENQHLSEAALQSTRRAIFAAQQVNAPESLYRWQWQAGRLLRATGKEDDAVSAYRGAISSLESIRQGMSNCYGRPHISFRESAGPLYLDFVDFLLQRAAASADRKIYQSYLIEAREVVELLKAYELRDYFRDDCVDAARIGITRLDQISSNAVVIYPIIFPDRTELLVSLPTGMKRFSVGIGADAMAEEVDDLRKNLEKRTTHEYLPYAQRLYDWLIRPFEDELQALPIDTLIFVPDGPLRTIPMAALHDGRRFLITRYALAITPGLNLTDPRALGRDNTNVLVTGLTESAQGFPPLPYVSEEVQAIHGLFKSNLLLNRDFILPNFERALGQENFTVVHIASHGQFDGDVEKTFLLAFDAKLTMDRLDHYVGLYRFRENPLELLTLSACETAVGDDRAALGLAGIAIRAGARSALATLWHINDQASSLLVEEFYRQLKNPLITKAAALQNAQVKLLNDYRYQHPGYWSPFLLVNNWL